MGCTEEQVCPSCNECLNDIFVKVEIDNPITSTLVCYEDNINEINGRFTHTFFVVSHNNIIIREKDGYRLRIDQPYYNIHRADSLLNNENFTLYLNETKNNGTHRVECRMKFMPSEYNDGFFTVYDESYQERFGVGISDNEWLVCEYDYKWVCSYTVPEYQLTDVLESGILDRIYDKVLGGHW